MRATYFFSEYPIAYRILASYIQNLEVYIILNPFRVLVLIGLLPPVTTDCRIAFL